MQVYVKPCKEYKIILRSIDLGAIETVTTYEELSDFMQVGSPFSIPKAALVLAGFQPEFSADVYVTLEEQLKAFGSGIEITLLSAIPAGSGLGTSSILASTVLGAVSDFCGLKWDKNEICNRTLIWNNCLLREVVGKTNMEVSFVVLSFFKLMPVWSKVRWFVGCLIICLRVVNIRSVICCIIPVSLALLREFWLRLYVVCSLTLQNILHCWEA